MGESNAELGRDITDVVDAVLRLGSAHGAANLLAASSSTDLAPDVNAFRSDQAHFEPVIQQLSAMSSEFSRLVAGQALRRSSTHSGNTMTYPGGAWFVARLIEDGIRLAQSRQNTDPEGLRRALTEVIDATLTSFSTGRSEMDVYLGLVGVSLAGTTEADIGLGVLRCLTKEEAHIFSTSNHAADTDQLCLVCKTLCHWEVLDGPPSKPTPQEPAQFDLTQQLGVLLYLAGARNRNGELRTPQSVWNRTSPYFFQGGSMSYGANPDLQWRKPSRVFDVIVAPPDAEECRSMAPKVSDLNLPVLHTFLPRLLRASQVYNAPDEDRLIDGTVAWEALFGSHDNSQLSLQLALAMAWLLEPKDHEKRLELFKKCKNIYSLRSTIVHGGPLKPQQQQRLAESAHELLELLRRALLEILASNKVLLAAKDRTTPIMLQIPSDTE